MRYAAKKSPAGFTLIETLVVIAITGTLIGLLVSAVQSVRESAAVVQCKDNLKHIGLATHGYHALHKRLFPGIGDGGGNMWGTGHSHMLPHVEQELIINAVKPSNVLPWQLSGTPARENVVLVFICPAAPNPSRGIATLDDGTKWAITNYGGNVQVFCEVGAAYNYIGGDASRTLTAIGDGTSNTIIFGEKYGLCGRPGNPGGSFWAYDYTGPYTQPYHPGFGINWHLGSIGPGSKFQKVPRPTDCDPSLAATPHRGGMNVCMADGAVRTLSHQIEGGIWWALCTPDRGEIVGEFWTR